MRFLAALLVGLCCTGYALAGPNFPELTGRVVDGAKLLSASTQQELTRTLEGLAGRTTTQVVVVTVPSLGGVPIEEYGYQLGRHWGIGDKEKNNGLLLIVAPKERRVRIEVGYGLEAVMTDAQATRIIQTVILPAFKRNALQAGIVDGTQAIVQVLEADMGPQLTEAPAFVPHEESRWFPYIGMYLLMQFWGVMLYLVAAGITVFIGFRRGKALSVAPLKERMPRFLRKILWAAFPVGMVMLYSKVESESTFGTGTKRGSFSSFRSNYSSSSSRSSSSSSSSSSRSSSSSGGGSFGGGGSSGSW